mgnify:CR=1 FL=1
MTLYQFLRMLEHNCPVKIIDLQNNVLDSSYDKSALSINNFDYDVFKVGLNTVKNFAGEPNCISITIVK